MKFLEMDVNLTEWPELSRGPCGAFRAAFRSGSVAFRVSMTPREWRAFAVQALDLYEAEMSAPARNVADHPARRRD